MFNAITYINYSEHPMHEYFSLVSSLDYSLFTINAIWNYILLSKERITEAYWGTGFDIKTFEQK